MHGLSPSVDAPVCKEARLVRVLFALMISEVATKIDLWCRYILIRIDIYPVGNPTGIGREHFPILLRGQYLDLVSLPIIIRRYQANLGTGYRLSSCRTDHSQAYFLVWKHLAQDIQIADMQQGTLRSDIFVVCRHLYHVDTLCQSHDRHGVCILLIGGLSNVPSCLGCLRQQNCTSLQALIIGIRLRVQLRVSFDVQLVDIHGQGIDIPDRVDPYLAGRVGQG